MGISPQEILSINIMDINNKVIWMIWLQGIENAPDLVKACVESWQRHNQTWEVRLLSEQDISVYLNIEDYPFDLNKIELSMAHKTDVIRALLLKKYGGVWADCTLYCCAPIDSWLNIRSLDFFAFRNPGRDRMISNWFMCSKKNGYIINCLILEITDYWQHGTKSRFKYYTIDKILNVFPNIWFCRFLSIYLKKMPYFWFHYLFSKRYHSDNRFKELWDSGQSMSADGPHKAQKIGLCKVLNDVTNIYNERLNKFPVYKLSWKYDSSVLQEKSTIQYFIRGEI